MSKLYKQLPFARKLIFISLLPILIVSILILLFSSLVELSKTRNQFIHQSQILSNVVSSNIGPAVLFGDMSGTNKVLDSLKHDKNVVYVKVSTLDGVFNVDRFFGQAVDGIDKIINNPEYASAGFDGLSLFLVNRVPIDVDGESIGEMILVTDTRDLQRVLVDEISLILILVVIASVIAFTIARRFHKDISDPILRLRKVMQQVSRTNDYTIRTNSYDEALMRDLFTGFENMLDQIEHREIELRAHRQKAEQQVELRLKEIEVINRKRIFWLENMAYFLQHELKNKVVGFNSSLDIIERKVGEIEIEKYLLRARKSTTLMNLLIQSIGNASDFEATLWNESRSVVNLSALVAEQVEEYRSNFSRIEFSIDIQPGIKIHGNSARIIQALDKLVSNAIEHNREDSPIDISVYLNDDQNTLRVANFGNPLPDDPDTMFDLFVSSNLSTENRGMGLYIVKQIVENHNGEILVSAPESGQGAIFELFFPYYLA